MKELIEYILQFGNLNQQQIKLVSKKMTELELNKGEYFSEAGKIPRRIGFVLDYKSFEANITSAEYLQAVTNCKLIVFSKEDWEDLSNTIVGWDSIVNKMIQKALAQKLERRSPLSAQDATTRYLMFLEKFPMLANRIPLSYLASYLGITQSSLSRIRKKIR